jgi:hypothetical protein
MESDELLERVRAIPGVMEARIMHGRQRDRLYVTVASGDANPVNRRVHPLLEQYRTWGCYTSMLRDRTVESMTRWSGPYRA